MQVSSYAKNLDLLLLQANLTFYKKDNFPQNIEICPNNPLIQELFLKFIWSLIIQSEKFLNLFCTNSNKNIFYKKGIFNKCSQTINSKLKRFIINYFFFLNDISVFIFTQPCTCYSFLGLHLRSRFRDLSLRLNWKSWRLGPRNWRPVLWTFYNILIFLIYFISLAYAYRNLYIKYFTFVTGL